MSQEQERKHAQPYQRSDRSDFFPHLSLHFWSAV
ncbi:hypothetical protein J2W27_000360 [Variovorax boronicumulans]|nr:hypothetical protein [Variovorax boronicumulans]